MSKPDQSEPATPAVVAPFERPVVPLVPEQWAPRDASWYNTPHISGLSPRWHRVGSDGMALCGHPAMLATMDYGDGMPPGESFKCARCTAWLKRHNAELTGRRSG